MNCVMQLGIGSHLRERARKMLGIDLNHGALEHQSLAREGSIFDDTSTLDMSSASDRWARELVRFLIDGDWIELLNATRATHTVFEHPKDAKRHRRLYLEKFSSMGNGFTFELETILFATLALVVQEDEGVPGVVKCYGDDLIVPRALAIPVLSRLSQVGHKPNLRKSFIEGRFRESCGGDFFSGRRVNTVKLETLPEEPQHWISLANNLKRVCLDGSLTDDDRRRRWALVLPVWKKVVSYLPTHVSSCRGPRHLGDTVIRDDPKYWTWNHQGVSIRAYQPVISRRPLRGYLAEPGTRDCDGVESPSLAAIAAATLTSHPLSSGIPLREVAGYRLRWVHPHPSSDWLPGTKATLVRWFSGYDAWIASGET